LVVIGKKVPHKFPGAYRARDELLPERLDCAEQHGPVNWCLLSEWWISQRHLRNFRSVSRAESADHHQRVPSGQQYVGCSGPQLRMPVHESEWIAAQDPTLTGAPTGVPEPATQALLLCGIAGLWVYRRRRNAHA